VTLALNNNKIAAEKQQTSIAAYPEVGQAVAALHVLHAQAHLPVGILLVLQQQKGREMSSTD
jgi:hypothetical protein